MSNNVSHKGIVAVCRLCTKPMGFIDDDGSNRKIFTGKCTSCEVYNSVVLPAWREIEALKNRIEYDQD